MSTVDRKLAGTGNHPADPGRTGRELCSLRPDRQSRRSSPASSALVSTARSADAHKGKLGAEISPEAGQEAARLCAINLLAQLKSAVGDLDRVTRCVRLGGFINAVPTFAALAPVMNGASDLMVEVLGEGAAMPAPPSASPNCRSMPASRSKAMFEVK